MLLFKPVWSASLGWFEATIIIHILVDPHWPYNVSHGLSREARVKGVMLRWWQPRHDGAGHDQWALDHVEVVLWVPNSQPAHGPPDWPPKEPWSAPVFLCLSLTCRNGPLYSTRTQGYSIHIHTTVITCTCVLLSTYNQPFSSYLKCFYLKITASGKHSRRMTAVCFAVKGSVCGWLFCVLYDRSTPAVRSSYFQCLVEPMHFSESISYLKP